MQAIDVTRCRGDLRLRERIGRETERVAAYRKIVVVVLQAGLNRHDEIIAIVAAEQKDADHVLVIRRGVDDLGVQQTKAAQAARCAENSERSRAKAQ